MSTEALILLVPLAAYAILLIWGALTGRLFNTKSRDHMARRQRLDFYYNNPVLNEVRKNAAQNKKDHI